MPVSQILSKILPKLLLNEKTWSHTRHQEKARFLKVINNLVVYQFFKEIMNHKIFSCRCIPNILKYCDHRLNFPKVTRSRFLERQIEKFSWYIWMFRFTVLQNYHWNTMKTRNSKVIKVGYDPTWPTWELKEYYIVSA